MSEPVGSLSALISEVRASRDYRRLTSAIPYLRFLGIELEDQGARRVAVLRYAEKLIGNSGIPALHGGAIGALLESAAIVEVLLSGESSEVPKIVTLSVDFLRSGRPQDTFAAASVTRLGKRVANVSIDAWQGDPQRPIAAAHGVLLLPG